jgi:hypothetical protein
LTNVATDHPEGAQTQQTDEPPRACSQLKLSKTRWTARCTPALAQSPDEPEPDELDLGRQETA